IGATFQALGRWDDTVTALDSSLGLKVKVLRTDHPSILSTASLLAGLWDNHARLDSAVSLYRHVHDCREVKLGPYHSDTLVSLCDLGRNLMAVGRPEDAEEILSRAYSRLSFQLGPGH
ncbi:hypothetical protein K470DRAFT_205293, partial [Piedraia hortae CBS 480.64]